MKKLTHRRVYIQPSNRCIEVELSELLAESPNGTDDGMGGDPDDPNNTTENTDPEFPFS